MRRGRGSLRRRVRDVPSGRRRRTRDGHLYVGTANVGRQWRAKRVHCTPGLGGDGFAERLLVWGPRPKDLLDVGARFSVDLMAASDCVGREEHL